MGSKNKFNVGDMVTIDIGERNFRSLPSRQYEIVDIKTRQCFLIFHKDIGFNIWTNPKYLTVVE